jgi:hypothetical protein
MSKAEDGYTLEHSEDVLTTHISSHSSFATVKTCLGENFPHEHDTEDDVEEP